MKLTKTYVLGVHFTFYEIELLSDYVDGCLNMLHGIENPENITFDICFNISQYFEKMDESKRHYIQGKYDEQMMRLIKLGNGVNVVETHKTDLDPVYNIAQYRHNLNEKYSDLVGYVCWGESDSFFPAQTFEIIERIDSVCETKKHVISFSCRKMWDESFKQIEHPLFTNEIFQDNEEWTLNNEASEKCTMEISRMNEINLLAVDPEIIILNKPKFDGSAVIFSSDLIKDGVNIPKSLLLCAEDTAMGVVAEKIMGSNYVQYHVRNILRCHNRRNIKKRNYIVGENNTRGFCGEQDKGSFWPIISKMSKENLNNLGNPKFKSWTFEDCFNEIRKLEK